MDPDVDTEFEARALEILETLGDLYEEHDERLLNAQHCKTAPKRADSQVPDDPPDARSTGANGSPHQARPP